MVSQETIAIVKSTAPVLAEHGEAITRVFYQRLFANHPELKNIFNMTHQQKGSQPKVLANAVFMYAQYIDQLDQLGGLVASITEKHTSLSIQPAMYPIVGENLLAAIGEVLGEAATPAIVNAWGEAYNALAGILINQEEALYAERAEHEGGFRGKQAFIVVKKVKESAVITSFYLKREDGQPTPTFKPGQYIALTVDIPNTTHQHTRNYSLSTSPSKGYLRISVKQEKGNPDGIVSNYLHEEVEEGATLMVGMPAGEFFLDETAAPVVLMAGGVGITPLMSMYETLVEKNNRSVTFIQCAEHSGVHAFRSAIEKATDDKRKSLVAYSNPLENDVYDAKGYLTASLLETIPNLSTCQFYFCGPTAFMKHCLQLLNGLGIPSAQINYEFFGPAEELAIEPALA